MEKAIEFEVRLRQLRLVGPLGPRGQLGDRDTPRFDESVFIRVKAGQPFFYQVKSLGCDLADNFARRPECTNQATDSRAASGNFRYRRRQSRPVEFRHT